jgi:hypothetical protein
VVKITKMEVLKRIDFAYEILVSKAVSTIRRPIESFFNWINEIHKYKKQVKSGCPKVC